MLVVYTAADIMQRFDDTPCQHYYRPLSADALGTITNMGICCEKSCNDPWQSFKNMRGVRIQAVRELRIERVSSVIKFERPCQSTGGICPLCG